MTPPVEIRAIPLEAARPIRQRVLRPGQPLDSTRYPSDQLPEAWHAGAFLGADLVGIASVYREPPPGADAPTAWRLRGMAVLPEHQGQGYGTALVRACLAQVQARGGTQLWCNGRVSAQRFYEGLGFVAQGAVFDLPVSGPHYLFVRPV
jgi:GNAT superfamily N-acetyltransferase